MLHSRHVLAELGVELHTHVLLLTLKQEVRVKLRHPMLLRLYLLRFLSFAEDPLDLLWLEDVVGVTVVVAPGSVSLGVDIFSSIVDDELELMPVTNQNSGLEAVEPRVVAHDSLCDPWLGLSKLTKHFYLVRFGESLVVILSSGRKLQVDSSVEVALLSEFLGLIDTAYLLNLPCKDQLGSSYLCINPLPDSLLDEHVES